MVEIMQDHDVNASTSRPPVDLYGPVHRGIRWALCSLLARMGATDFSDRTRVPLLLDDLDGVLYLCASHVEHEDRHIHAAIQAKDPEKAMALDAEHRAHEEAIAELRRVAESLESAPLASIAEIGNELYLKFSHFVAENLAHMFEEETVIAPLLAERYSPDALWQIHDALMASVGPDELLAFARVMVPGNRIDVGVALLTGARAAMPADVFASVLRSFRSNLGDSEWRALTERLGVAA
jgi:iron-sulfur cluster repair protein YtfE (RIC family)